MIQVCVRDGEFTCELVQRESERGWWGERVRARGGQREERDMSRERQVLREVEREQILPIGTSTRVVVV